LHPHNEKKSTPTPTQNLKENKIKALGIHAEPSHWLHENFYVPKLFITIFGLG
jgi:hypothetical protein